MSVGAGQAFDNLEGPAITQRIATARAVGDLWELTQVPRQASERPTVLTLRLDPRGTAKLGWKGAGVDEVQIERAAPGDRSPGAGEIDWAKAEVRDKARRVRTKALLDAGALASGDDFFYAAFIF